MKKINRIGERYGRLIVKRPAEGAEIRSYTMWYCICDCGGELLVANVSLSTGATKSCGCLGAEMARDRLITHGKSRTPEYAAWRNMMSRCYDKTNIGYHNYGGRGIVVCDAWHEFEMFLSDMGVRPEGMSIDRINNNIGYSKSNCAWSNKEQQCSNTRRNRKLTYLGKTQTVTQWAKELNMDRAVLSYRANHWNSDELCLTAPLHRGVTPSI